MKQDITTYVLLHLDYQKALAIPAKEAGPFLKLLDSSTVVERPTYSGGWQAANAEIQAEYPKLETLRVTDGELFDPTAGYKTLVNRNCELEEKFAKHKDLIESAENLTS